MRIAIASTGFENNYSCFKESEPLYTVLKKKLLEVIWTSYKGGADSFYVNCEKGIPLMAAEIIASLKIYHDIELNIICPHEEQSANWSERTRERYFNVHQKADEVTFAFKGYKASCYADTDRIIADECDGVILFCSESEYSYIPKNAEFNNRPMQLIGVSR